ncbi:MAG TPA: hypothetical protein VFH78_00045, partial [Candidatus Thermoplasmatota archaeon]|nr:hypothetical protein [Candidatus Thermoplasmatota archaeon]
YRSLQLGGDGAITGFAFDPADPLRAFASATMDLAASKLIETRDGGMTWTVAFTLPEFDIWDVAWDSTTGKPLIATELGVLVYEGAGIVTPRGAALDSRAVAERDGRSWSGGPAPSVWSGADGAPHAPFAHTGAAILDLAPDARESVWAASVGGAVSRCTLGACEDVSTPAKAAALLVRPDGGAVFAATDNGIYRAFIGGR